MNSPRANFYRDTSNGKLLGVCAGLADYTGISVLWWRLALIILTLLSGGSVLLGYLALSLLTNAKPPHHYGDPQEQQYWQGVRQSPRRTAREIRSHFRDIDKRLAAMETHYISSNQRLADEIEKLR